MLNVLSSQGTGKLMPDHALFIDHKGFRYAVYSPIDSNASFAIGDAYGIRITQFGQPTLGIAWLILVVQADDIDQLFFGETVKNRVFGATRHTP